VVLPEHVEKVVIAHFGGIVLRLYHLGASRPAGADIPVSGVFQRAAEVANEGVLDAGTFLNVTSTPPKQPAPKVASCVTNPPAFSMKLCARRDAVRATRTVQASA
jgi:hypothetical protein